jgi:tetratricopeptide (TPR) repeat protein
MHDHLPSTRRPRPFACARLAAALAVAIGASISVLFSAHGFAQAGLDRSTLTDAHRAFYNARYEDAAALALALESAEPGNLAPCELRTSALLFQIKAAIGNQPDRDTALAQCAPCASLIAAFLSDTARGQAVARARLASAPDDDAALFYLGKIDLNYVWLQLGPLGRKKGWDEYWEARRSLDAVLKRNPDNVRARVARAWIDYIVDTRMPRGTRWVLGGGDRKRALLSMQAAADADASFFVHVEALFALWDLQVRERRLPLAIAIARRLAHEFPGNRELIKFLETPGA